MIQVSNWLEFVYGEGGAVLINLAEVAAVMPGDRGSAVLLRSGKKIKVADSYDVVRETIANVGKTQD